MEGGWLVRRLSPDCSRIELTSLPKKRDEGKLLYAMGFETANVHLGSPKPIGAIKRDLAKRKAKWLRVTVERMASVITSDWRDWARR
jgi:hypothetical protein